MPWSEEAFQIRVKARCRQLNRSLRSVLAEADLSLDTFQKPPALGRRVDTLAKLAVVLDWSIGEISGEPSDKIDPELLVEAFGVTKEGWPDAPSDEALMRVTARVYKIVADRFAKTGAKTLGPAERAVLVAYIAEEWR